MNTASVSIIAAAVLGLMVAPAAYAAPLDGMTTSATVWHDSYVYDSYDSEYMAFANFEATPTCNKDEATTGDNRCVHAEVTILHRILINGMPRTLQVGQK